MPSLHAIFPVLSFSGKASDIFSYTSPFLSCSHPVQGWLFPSIDVADVFSMIIHYLTLQSSAWTDYLTRQASFGRFALVLRVCKYFCKCQAAEDLGTVTASLEMLRFLVFYSDVQTQKLPIYTSKMNTDCVMGEFSCEE